MRKISQSSIRHSFYLTLFVLFMGMGIPSKVLPQTPPPLGPPMASEDAARLGSFSMEVYRIILQAAGDSIIEEHNASSEHKLSWAPGSKPTECGYDCVHAPYLSSTEFMDRPNQRVAMVRGHIEFDLDIAGSPFDRRIRTNVMLYVYCNGWREGSGDIDIIVKADAPDISEGDGIIEKIIDVILFPFQITNTIDDLVRQELGKGGTYEIPLGGSCCKLGVASHHDTGEYWLDEVIWELPKFTRPPVIKEFVNISFESIKRKKIAYTPEGPAEDISFLIYVNGKPLQIPESGTLSIATEEVMPLQNVGLSFPKTPEFEALQIIVTDSLGGTKWIQFDDQIQFGEGSHKIETTRKDFIPVGDPRNPTNKPQTTYVKEFEFSYSISVGPMVFKGQY